MVTKTIEVRDAQSHLPELVSYVAVGEEVILTQGDTPVARLVPIAAPATPRVAGLHVGVAWVSDDFDEPLPGEVWAAEERGSSPDPDPATTGSTRDADGRLA